MDFDDYLCSQNEVIDSIAFELLCAMAEPESEAWDEPVEWNQEMIAYVVASAERALEKRGIHPCHPFYDENEQPCYLGGECKKLVCPMKRSAANENTAL